MYLANYLKGISLNKFSIKSDNSKAAIKFEQDFIIASSKQNSTNASVRGDMKDELHFLIKTNTYVNEKLCLKFEPKTALLCVLIFPISIELHFYPLLRRFQRFTKKKELHISVISCNTNMFIIEQKINSFWHLQSHNSRGKV